MDGKGNRLLKRWDLTKQIDFWYDINVDIVYVGKMQFQGAVTVALISRRTRTCRMNIN